MAEVERLFSELDEAEAALGRARDALVEYRASLLHSACTGALTAVWRAANPRPAEDGPALLRRILAERRAAWESAELARLAAKGRPAPKGDAWKARYEEPQAPDMAGLPGLPEGWIWATVDQLTDFRGNGASRKPTAERTAHRILRISSVRPLNVDETQHRFYPEGTGDDLSFFTAQPGDLLFTRYSGSEHYVGACGLLRSGPILFPDKLMRAVPFTAAKDLGAYLEIVLNGGVSRRHVGSKINTTAGQKGVSGSAIRACPVPLPPADEMSELVRLFGEGEVTLEREGGELGSLRQSILHAAFTGRLVPQDPADEPAAALLARLRAAPAAPGRTPRRACPVQEALL